MKHFIFLILAFVSLVAPAQDTSSDTIIAPELKEQELQEIVVEAPKVIHKADMDVYHPSRSEIGRAHV